MPFLTMPAPSARYHRQGERRQKKLTDWARQMILQPHRWLPQHPIVPVRDTSYAVLDLLHCIEPSYRKSEGLEKAMATPDNQQL